MAPSQGPRGSRPRGKKRGLQPMDHRQIGARRTGVTIALAATAWAATATAAGPEQSLAEVERMIGIAEGAVMRLDARLAVKDPGRATASLMAQVNEGLVYHQLREHKRAAMILLRVVDDPANTASPVFQDALFYLADALYQDRNYAAAESYFRDVLKRNFEAYYKDALLRLIEISFSTHRHEDVGNYFDQLAKFQGSVLEPKFPYVHGRTLYRHGRFEDALSQFMTVPRGSEPYIQARYLAAVTHVNLGHAASESGRRDEATQRFATAIQLLEDVLKDQPPRSDDDHAVVELVHLTLGRLYYEIDEFSKSVDHYQEIPRESAWFDHALYEVCWTYVKNHEHDKALRALDILLLALPDSPFAPEASLVRGNLQLRLERFDDATDTFSTLLQKFQPVKDELDDVVRKNPDPVKYFNKIIAESADKFDVSVVLPRLASGWVTTKDEVGRAVALVGDLHIARTDVDEAKALIDTLEAALAAGNRVEIFGDLRQVAGEAVERQKQLVLLKKQLNDAERALVVRFASEVDRGALEQASQARRNAESDFATVPTTDAEVRKREAKVEKSLGDVEGQAFELSLAIDSIQAQLRAFEKYMADLRSEQHGDKVAEAQLEKAVLDEMSRLRALEGELREARRHIEVERRGVGMGDDVTKQERALKDKLSASLDEEAAVFAGLRAKSGGSEVFGRIDAARRRVVRADERLAGVLSQVETAVEDATKQFAAQVRAEKARLDQYTGNVAGFGQGTEDLAGRIAYDNFKNVRQMFEGIVLQADLGLVDVAWARKEETSTAIDRILDDRKGKVEELDGDYDPVRKEGE